MKKTLILVIIFSILIGGLIFVFLQVFGNKSQTTPPVVSPLTQIFAPAITTPSPSPTPSINSSTNLENAAQNLTPKDFSPDFQNLKEEVNNF